MSDASFARTLAVALKQRSQVAVAAALGVSPQLVSDWKRGRRRPPPGQVFALERVLATEPGMLSRHLGFVPVDAEDAAATGITDQVRERVAALLGDPLPELEQLVPDMDDFTSRAAARGFGLELLRLAVDDFEREHGAFSTGELERARARLDQAARSSPASAA